MFRLNKLLYFEYRIKLFFKTLAKKILLILEDFFDASSNLMYVNRIPLIWGWK